MAKKSETDDKILALIKEVDRQKAEIAKIEKPQWKTNCSFPWIEGRMNEAVNIHVESNLKTLISMAAHVQNLAAGYESMAEQLGLESSPTFTWNGFNAADWLDDIKMRIEKIQIGKRREKLAALEDRLAKIISPELRAKMELEAIESELS